MGDNNHVEYNSKNMVGGSTATCHSHSGDVAYTFV